MSTDNDKFEALEAQVVFLTEQLTRLQDIEEIKQLQYKYGYYMDKCLYKQVVSLFADNPDARVTWMGGIWKGKSGVKRVYVAPPSPYWTLMAARIVCSGIDRGT